MTDISDDNDSKTRQIAWPGGRLVEHSAEPLTEERTPADYFSGSDLSETDPNWTGLWPEAGQPHAPTFASAADRAREDRPPVAPPAAAPAFSDSFIPAAEWPPAAEDPQLPPRAWPPDQLGAPPPPFVPEAYVPDTLEETVRRSGLAYSAGIVFFVSVAFMLLLGWLVDLLLGSSPFGLVAGIVIGSAIGFIQFFYISKQIYEPSNKKSEIRTLMSGPDDDDTGAGL